MAKKKARKAKRKQREKKRAERKQQWQVGYEERAQAKAQRKAEAKRGWTSDRLIDGLYVTEEQRKEQRRVCEEALERVRQGENPDQIVAGEHGEVLMMYALSCGFADICEELVCEHGAYSFACDGALVCAGGSGDLETVQFVLQRMHSACIEAGVSIACEQAMIAEEVSGAVVKAVIKANAGEDVLGLLQSAGADLNAVQSLGLGREDLAATPLKTAVGFGRIRSVRALLKLGVDDTHADSDVSRTVLEFAGDKGDLVRVELAMLEHYLGRKIVSEEDLVHACDVAVQQGKYTNATVQVMLRRQGTTRPPGGLSMRQFATGSHAMRVAQAAAREGVPLEGNDVLMGNRSVVDWVVSVLKVIDSRQPEPRTPAVCFLWSKYGLCKYGDACLFAHAESSRPADPPSAPFQHASHAVCARAEDLAHLREVLEPHVVDGVFSA